MIENPDFRQEPNLSVRLNRRQFLKLTATATGSVILQAACGPLEQIAYNLGYTAARRLEIPSSYINELEEVTAPLTRLMPSIRQNVAIKVSKTGNGIYYDKMRGYALLESNEIIILIPDVSPENINLGKVVAFHEAGHIFDQGKKPSGYLKEEVKKRTGRSTYARNELKIIKESSYCNIDSCRGMGHPKDNFSEVFASSLTILRFYPFEFIEKLEGLNNPESKRFLATSGLVCIDALKKFSAIPVEYSDLPFDPNLVAYLLKEGKTSVL